MDKSTQTLSKSKILAYRQCPKRLWLEIHHPELREDTAEAEASFKVGHQVGDIARGIYDPGQKGVLIEPYKIGFSAAFKQTKELLVSKQPIFEAAMTASDTRILADVMLPINKRGKTRWKMVEVKSSASIKDYHRDDVAIQAYVATKAGAELEKIALATIDSDWLYPGNNLYLGLLEESDLTDEAFNRMDEVKAWISDAHRISASKREPEIEASSHCNQPYSCGFQAYCSRDIPRARHPVNWLPNIRTKELKSFIEDNDITELREIPDNYLNDQQLRVKQGSLSGKVYFDKVNAKKDLSGYGLPAYFLDFETIQFAVPIWKGTRPYQQIPFQFSLHKLGRNEKLSHSEFLDLSGKDPSKVFADNLISSCGKTGPVYVYNAGFETARIKELAGRFSKLKSELLAINDRIVDLYPIAKRHYYHPDQCGSWSIKKVLPAIAPELSYEELEGVQDGGMAMDAYLEAIAKETPAARKKEIEIQLQSYCKLDTFALVKLWQFFSASRLKFGNP